MSKSKQATNTEPFTREQLLSYKTTSSKVRFLHSLGIDRSEISKILNIRYQHVRNVLVTELKKSH